MLASLGEKPNGGTTMEKVDTAAIAAPVVRNAFGPAASKLLILLGKGRVSLRGKNL